MESIHNIIHSKKNRNKNSLYSSLVKGKIPTNPESMAEKFNEYFTSSGNNLHKKIPSTKKHSETI